MKKKTLNIILLLLILGLLTGVALWFGSRNQSSTLDPRFKDFAVENVKTVDKLFIADNDSNTILLEKQEDGTWWVNGQYRAQDHPIDLILKTIKRIRVKNPVPRSMKPTVLKNIATKSTKVEIYQGDEEPSKVYYFGTPTKDHLGTFMLLETPELGRSPEPYVTHVPGNQGFLTPRFFTNPDKWRYTGVFTYDPRNIRKVSVEHVEAPEKSFTIRFDGKDEIQLHRMNGEKVARFDTGQVRQYLLEYKKIHVEKYSHSLSPQQVDSVLQTDPRYVIRVTDKSGEQKFVEAYPMAASKGATDLEGDKLTYDLDRMYGWVNGKDLAIIQLYVFDRLFKPIGEFLPSSSTPYPASKKNTRKKSS